MVTRIDWTLRRKKEKIKFSLRLPIALCITTPIVGLVCWLLWIWEVNYSTPFEIPNKVPFWLILPVTFVWSVILIVKGFWIRKRLKKELEKLESDERTGRRHDL